ncbi:hypothetical protein VDF98_03725 [Xanthomonas campestris pv. raphani]|uniref:hypothetical protein n=1 Tax=Xanthomonas campestris TaxID=339 RepID=UPI00236879D6|nr:hypothetical protein [Xanthomonas campestris]MEA9822354.1 hypothetical protein [Xanthomonas campestris pv. raphani]MEA9850913.1 hypothetical protein [Xanthomonas campestris pv. raphani]MEA9855086.1 hypothetical protein [Xanthomonas campestris pv. raphani]MEA9963797.1 hypothetical protein [Xanthomonas campestris pv. raphani]WDJ20471.1 hypothetical protein JH270_10965 [Xanthomonas campestris pv. raphani]
MNAVPITFSHCIAIESDYYMIASKPDALDASEEFTRLFYFDAQAPNTWRHTDTPYFTAVDMCVVHRALGSQRRYAVLSRQGQVLYYWPGDQLAEKIEGAGLAEPGGPVYGYLNALKEIDGSLYVCGGGGQIYRRNGRGWSDMAGTLRKPAPLLKADLALHSPIVGDDLSDIDGYRADDLYVAGGQGIYHYGGHDWIACETSTDETLMAVMCMPGGVVWACGFNGAVMRGNAAEGFRDVSHYDDNMLLTNMAFFGRHLYFSSNQGLFRLDPQAPKSRLEKINMVPECEDVSVVGDVLLCVGPKSIHILQSGDWRELVHPDN